MKSTDYLKARKKAKKKRPIPKNHNSYTEIINYNVVLLPEFRTIAKQRILSGKIKEEIAKEFNITIKILNNSLR